jgi:hypothetical protein
MEGKGMKDKESGREGFVGDKISRAGPICVHGRTKEGWLNRLQNLNKELWIGSEPTYLLANPNQIALCEHGSRVVLFQD